MSTTLLYILERQNCGAKLWILLGCLLVIRSGTLFLMGSSGADAVSVVTRKIWDGMQFLQTLGF